MSLWLFSSDGHLTGPALAASLDGELSPSDVGRASEHVARCVSCRQALAAQRAARDMLRSGEEPVISEDLAARLSRMSSSSSHADPRPGVGASTLAAVGIGGQAAFIPLGVRRRRRRLAVVAVSLACAALALTWVGAHRVDIIVPYGIASLTTDSTAPELVGTPASPDELRADGWLVPDRLASGATLKASQRLADGGVMMTYAVAASTVVDIVVVEDEGRLSPQTTRGGTPVQVVSAEQGEEDTPSQVWLLSSSPWGVAWQSGPRVVTVAALDGRSLDSDPFLAALLIEFPATDNDDSMGSDFGRGLSWLFSTFHR